MGNKGHSEPNIFGGYTHYDDRGNKLGSSEPDLFGGFTDFDADGNRIGHSEPSVFGGYEHYDDNGKNIGRSDPSVFGGFDHYDSSGKNIGNSNPDFFGGYTNSDTEGPCYIATCVYGSYDCPEVWTLRRFRDYRLRKSSPGRLFIRLYYALSPTVVRLFGKNHAFRVFWKSVLDRWVYRLNKKGFSDLPYRDV